MSDISDRAYYRDTTRVRWRDTSRVKWRKKPVKAESITGIGDAGIREDDNDLIEILTTIAYSGILR